MDKFEIKEEYINHLKNCDPILRQVIDEIGEINREVSSDPFTSLVSSVVYQQLAYKAAKSIWDKFIIEIKDLTPLNLYNISDENLLKCGLSKMKVTYLKSIANAFLNEGYNNIYFNELTDEEVINTLIKIKGIGKWTAEMFLIFTLKRLNIITINDLGLKNGIKKLYKLDDINEEIFNEITYSYEPYKTIAAFYIWESLSKKDLNINYENLKYNIFVNKSGRSYMYNKLGWMKLETIENKLSSIEFVKYPVFGIMKTNKVLEKTINELKEYFDGIRKEFSVEYIIDGTPFQKEVYNELIKIPYGKTISYEELALNIKEENYKRAVASANGKNKIPIIIPCHRVINKNGKIGGYTGGIGIKEKLLRIEGVNIGSK